MFFYFLSKKNYVALIGDIKNSRNYEDREEIQSSLNQILDHINKKYKKQIAAQFLITLGDEFQGLLKDGSVVMDIILLIKKHMNPVRIRFGIGIGEIHTDVIKTRALGADGPAYYFAREAIEHVKFVENKSKTGKIDCYIQVEDKFSDKMPLLNQLLSMMYVIESSWQERQRQIIWDMLEHRDTQQTVASRQNIKQSSVSIMLDSGDYYSYQESYDLIKKILAEVNYGN